MNKPVVVIPNINGEDGLVDCINSLLAQTIPLHLIVVDNNSKDGSVGLIKEQYPDIELIINNENLGYTGGVNPGFKRAIELDTTYVAPFNNDAVADPRWIEELIAILEKHPEAGIASCKVLSADGTHIDSTGDYYTNWGLPYPRGRNETDISKYDGETEIFAGSGAASLYRVAMLKEVGLFDQDFFAYYEDVDLSFRAQLAGWKVLFVPTSIVYHETGSTSSKIKGFTTYQTMKNEPMLLWKNLPTRYLFTVGWRFLLAHTLFFLRALSRGQGWTALKGDAQGTRLLIKKYEERKRIQGSKKVSDEYIWNMMVHDLPPNAHALRSLRAKWWKLNGKNTDENSN